jgi:hypothetical protein
MYARIIWELFLHPLGFAEYSFTTTGVVCARQNSIGGRTDINRMKTKYVSSTKMVILCLVRVTNLARKTANRVVKLLTLHARTHTQSHINNNRKAGFSSLHAVRYAVCHSNALTQPSYWFASACRLIALTCRRLHGPVRSDSFQT